MAHPYEYHVDVRGESGLYFGALTRVLEGRRLHVRSCEMPTPPPNLCPHTALPPVVIRELSIPLALWTIRKSSPGSVLWSERDCIVVTCIDLHVLLDGGYIIIYNQDPFILDTQDWVTDFIHAQHRRNP